MTGLQEKEAVIFVKQAENRTEYGYFRQIGRKCVVAQALTFAIHIRGPKR